MVLTDHSPRLTVANGLRPERLREQLDVVAEVNERFAADGAGPPFRLLTGIECDILEDGRLDQEPELLARLDLVVASVHSKLRMPREEMTARMVAAISNPHTDVLGHCTGRQVLGHGRGGKGRPESEFDAEVVFAACARFGVAVEVNSRPERLDPPKRLLRLALEAGCDVAIDTDAHAPGQLDWQHLGCERAHLTGVHAGPGRQRARRRRPAQLDGSRCCGMSASTGSASSPVQVVRHRVGDEQGARGVQAQLEHALALARVVRPGAAGACTRGTAPRCRYGGRAPTPGGGRSARRRRRRRRAAAARSSSSTNDRSTSASNSAWPRRVVAAGRERGSVPSSALTGRRADRGRARRRSGRGRPSARGAAAPRARCGQHRLGVGRGDRVAHRLERARR